MFGDVGNALGQLRGDTLISIENFEGSFNRDIVRLKTHVFVEIFLRVFALSDRRLRAILQEHGVAADEAAIPYPYNNFWEVTTHDERAWAHRRIPMRSRG